MPAEPTHYFVDDEAPTRPGSAEYRAAMLVRAWRELSEADKRWLDRLLEMMAWSRSSEELPTVPAHDKPAR